MFEQKVVKKDDLLLWTESFGNIANPVIILIMGNGAQAIFWPQKFCEQLASEGYFVIRYDHRDTGLSSYFDFQQEPYTLYDMAKDVIYILDDYGIHQAHIFGVSVGAAISTILASHFSERIRTLTLGMTSPDFQVAIDAFLDKNNDSKLSSPQREVIEAARLLVKKTCSISERIDVFKKYAHVTSGSQIVTEELHQLALQSIQRTKDETKGNNHFLALQASYQIYKDSLNKIRAPTLIIHGDSDPIFSIDHAKVLNKMIQGSDLLIIPGLGHGLRNSIFYTPIINGIMGNIINS